MTTKKPIKKPTKKTVKKHVEKAATKRRSPHQRVATRRGATAPRGKPRAPDAAEGLLVRLAAAEKTTRTLCDLLTMACKYALDAADIIADERLVEAENDHSFRNVIEMICADAGISLPWRKPKSRLAGEEYVWVAEKTPAQLDREIAEVLATPKGEKRVAQRADHGGGMSGHDDDDDDDESLPARAQDGSMLAPTTHESTDDGDYGDANTVIPGGSMLDPATHEPTTANGSGTRGAEDDAPIQ